MKKIYLASLIIFCGISFTAFADSSAPSGGGSSSGGNSSGLFDQVSSAITQLGTEIQALAVAGAKSVNAAMYQLDQNIAVSLQANSTNPTSTVATATATNTQNQITNTFMQFPEQVINANQNSDPQLLQDINNRQQWMTNLTTNTPASDTLYLDSMTDPLASTQNVGKPSTLYDNYFNFDSLFEPNAYTSDQQQAAQAYLVYATQPYQSLTDGIEFSQLKSTLNNLSPDQRAQTLQNLMTSPAYQKYQLSIRSMIANKSIALSNLNYLLAERTPVKNLGSQAGMPNDPNLPAGYASPLEVQNYIANERINNPQWFQQMKTASPATVQREQVLILAEIESELQRNHLDNERLLAALSQMGLQTSQTNQLMLKTQIQDVNAVIDPNSNNNPSTANIPH